MMTERGAIHQAQRLAVDHQLLRGPVLEPGHAELQPGDERTLNLNFHTRPFHGRLTDHQGKPAGNRAIQVSHQGNVVAGITTNADGTFALPNVPSGKLGRTDFGADAAPIPGIEDAVEVALGWDFACARRDSCGG